MFEFRYEFAEIFGRKVWWWRIITIRNIKSITITFLSWFAKHNRVKEPFWGIKLCPDFYCTAGTVYSSLPVFIIYFQFSSLRHSNLGCLAKGSALLPMAMRPAHRYLIPRLSLKVVYLWRHVSSTAPPFILWWWNLETLFTPSTAALHS
jgi:hypothetical protein